MKQHLNRLPQPWLLQQEMIIKQIQTTFSHEKVETTKHIIHVSVQKNISKLLNVQIIIITTKLLSIYTIETTEP